MKYVSFSRKKLCSIALLLDEEKTWKKSVRRFAVHPMLKERIKEGEYWTLYKELIKDDAKYYGYFRMNRIQFEYIGNKITPLIKKQIPTFKEAISHKTVLENN